MAALLPSGAKLDAGNDAPSPMPDPGRRWSLRAWLGALDPARAVLAIILASAAVRLLIADMIGLGIDESYMVAAGRTLQMSYFDHPPLSWWLAWAAPHLFGSDAPVVVRLPFIALFALSTWLMFALTRRLYSERAGLWAAIAFNLSPVFGITSGSWVLPDGPLIAALLGFMICLVRATGPAARLPTSWWSAAGACAGLALLSKYTAVLVLFGAAAAVATHPARRRWLGRPGPWIGALLAALVFAPVLVWNARHGWASVAFQGGRASGGVWHPWAPFVVLAGEALFVLPWIWVPMMIALAGAWRRGRADWPGWLLACSGTPAIVLFALIGLRAGSHVLFHWAAPGYLVLFPLLGALLARWAPTRGGVHLRRTAAITAAVIVAVVTIMGSQVRWNWVPLIPGNPWGGLNPGLAAVDWTSLLPQLERRGLIGPEAPVIGAVRWLDAGKLGYALDGAATVICLGDDPRQFGFSEPAAAHRGQDVLVIAPNMDTAQIHQTIGPLFERIEKQPPLTLLHNGRQAMELPVYLGKTLR